MAYAHVLRQSKLIAPGVEPILYAHYIIDDQQLKYVLAMIMELMIVAEMYVTIWSDILLVHEL